MGADALLTSDFTTALLSALTIFGFNSKPSSNDDVAAITATPTATVAAVSVVFVECANARTAPVSVAF